MRIRAGWPTVVPYPFNDELHEARFAEGRALSRRGGPLAPVCGARTRGGGSCRQAPLTGHTRCLRHAGPKAARAYRQRQFENMQAGKISYAHFEQAEAKRAANRLRDQWKKDPWVHGRTIDLGEHEMAFQADLAHWVGPLAVPPAVMDWLRWRYRRLQIDRGLNEDWTLLLRDEVPRRVRDAGEAPIGWSEPGAASGAAWQVDEAPVAGKRVRGDALRPRRTDTPVPLPTPSKGDLFDPLEVARIVNDCRDMLLPLLALCRTEDERSSLVAALVHYCKASPDEAGPRKAWQSTVAALRSR